jgi:DNA invertase Pin-like site-specific DNA recombinase
VVRAVGYCRVSTEEQAKGGVSLEAQRRYIEEWCRREGWRLVAVFSDVASGRDLRRRGLQRLLRMVKEGRVDVVVAYHNDRLSRSVVDMLKIRDFLRQHGAVLQCGNLMGLDVTRPEGEFVLTQMAAVAQFYRRDLGLKTSLGMREKKRQGLHMGRPPFGFEADPRNRGRLILKDPRVLEAWRLKDEGWSQKAIALELGLKEYQVSRLIRYRPRLEKLIQGQPPREAPPGPGAPAPPPPSPRKPSTSARRTPP